LEQAQEYYNNELIAVDHDEIFKAEMLGIFETPCYKSRESRAIIFHAAKYPLTAVLLTIYTTYHSSLYGLFLSWLKHNTFVTLVELFDWMEPLMNLSFLLRLTKLSLFPTMSARLHFRILVQSIQETPGHHPNASRFLDIIWLSTCEYCACEITSGYFDMALLFILRLCPMCLKQHIVKITPNKSAPLFRQQHFNGAQNRIHLSTDHTMQV
jgi:hypothetical protein